MRPIRLAAALAVAPLLAAQARAVPDCPSELRLLVRPEGRELARTGLDREGGFTLSFRHSVTLRTVVERYRIEDGRIVQIEQSFDSHGPGLPDRAEPGLVFVREGDRFRVLMHRPIERLLLRPLAASENRLEAGARIDLWTLGAPALELAPAPCPAPPPAREPR